MLALPCHKAKRKMIVLNSPPIMIDRGGKIQMVYHFIWFTFFRFLDVDATRINHFTSDVQNIDSGLGTRLAMGIQYTPT
jgi:hypothetical protein